jgi:phage baseplate assembly protein V
MMMRQMLNLVRVQAQQALPQQATVRLGMVESYDPQHYRAKVRLQPEEVLTGWLPIVSPWVGNGWGFFAPPSIGDVVEVLSQEGVLEAGFVGQRFYNEIDQPLTVPEGECWLVHRCGSCVKFHNDGSVEIQSAQMLRATVNGEAQLTVKGKLQSTATQWQHTGALNVTGDVTIEGHLQVTEAITGQGGLGISGGQGAQVQGRLWVTQGDISAEGVSLTQHTHGGVEPGNSNTGAPK